MEGLNTVTHLNIWAVLAAGKLLWTMSLKRSNAVTALTIAVWVLNPFDHKRDTAT